jgi:TPR repeat protein
MTWIARSVTAVLLACAASVASAAPPAEAPDGCEWRGAEAGSELWCRDDGGTFAEAEIDEDFNGQTVAEARAGDPAAMRALAGFLHDGPPAQRDNEAAAQWFRKAAEKGDVEAMSRLGQLYEDGDGVREDRAQAEHWDRAAAERGDTDAMIAMSRFARDANESWRWMQMAADHGDPGAMGAVGYRLYFGERVPKDQTRGLKLMRAAAAKGDTASLFDLGQGMLHGLPGLGSPADPPAGAGFLREAADAGDALAMAELGRLLMNGAAGVAKDPDAALRWLRAAAKKGNDQAKHDLARLGEGAPLGPGQDWALTDAAARRGDVAAMAAMGKHAYDSALSSANSSLHYHEAAGWWAAAALRGDAGAMDRLVGLYAHGLGVVQDKDLAERLRKALADRGLVAAMVVMGDSCERANNPSMAAIWYRAAAERGDKSAAEAFERLKKRP